VPSLAMFVRREGKLERVRTLGWVDFNRNVEQILIDQGLVDDRILAEAKAEAANQNCRLLDVLRRKLNLEEMELYRSLARQRGMRFTDADEILPDLHPALFRRFSRTFLDLSRLIPIAEEDGRITVVTDDPDAILVGEIRDQETALEAIRASQTGHVVLSTLHCNDAVDSLQRLYDLGIHPNSIAGELLAVIAQRLAKRICRHCSQSAEPDPVILSEVFPDGPPADFRCFEGAGCDKCNGRGTRGRVAIVEYMEVDPDIRNAISSQPPIGELRWRALDAGLVTMRDSALDHVIEGIIPLSELPRILPRERMAPEVRGGRRSRE